MNNQQYFTDFNKNHENDILWIFFTKKLFDIWNDYIENSVGFKGSVADSQIVRKHIDFVNESTKDFLQIYKPDIELNIEGLHNWTNLKNFCAIDLIDGTSSLLLGTPLFGFQLAFVENGIIEEVIIFLPTEYKLGNGGMYRAKRNKGAYLIYNGDNPVKLKVSTVKDLANATIVFDGPTKSVAKLYSNPIVENVCRIRNFSSFCWAGSRLARGNNLPVSIDTVIGINNKPWDHIPYVLLITEAGGVVTNFQGNTDLVNYENIVFSNGFLHDKILKYLNI